MEDTNPDTTNELPTPEWLPRLYTAEEAASILKCTEHFLTRGARNGQLPCLTYKQKTLRFTDTHLLSIIKANESIPDGYPVEPRPSAPPTVTNYNFYELPRTSPQEESISAPPDDDSGHEDTAKDETKPGPGKGPMDPRVLAMSTDELASYPGTTPRSKRRIAAMALAYDDRQRENTPTNAVKRRQRGGSRQ